MGELAWCDYYLFFYFVVAHMPCAHSHFWTFWNEKRLEKILAKERRLARRDGESWEMATDLVGKGSYTSDDLLILEVGGRSWKSNGRGHTIGRGPMHSHSEQVHKST
jgi:hypothetical protein